MSNIGATAIGKSAKNLNISSRLNGFSKVVINVTKELYYEAGDDSGRTLTFDMPWGNQDMASNVLSLIKGFQYQPYDSSDSILDPAVELGDGITINGVYSGVFSMSQKCGPLHLVDVSAPYDAEIEHEYHFVSKSDRRIERRIANTESELLIQADNISAKVSETGGDDAFSWELKSSGFLLKDGGETVFQADSSGINVTGQINATSGYIGSSSRGFLIGENSISNGKPSFSDDKHNGVYIGTDGISLGKGMFKVDAYGNLYASSGTFAGSVYAKNIQVGEKQGYIQGNQIKSKTIGKSKFDSNVQGNLDGGAFAGDVFAGRVKASYGKFTTMHADGGMWEGKRVRTSTISLMRSNGQTVNLQYLQWADY